jgi:hypothetical protein
MTMGPKSFSILTAALGLGIGAFFAYPLGMVHMKWTVGGELRDLRAENHKLANDARKLAAAAFVCMDHCGTHTCEGLK